MLNKIKTGPNNYFSFDFMDLKPGQVGFMRVLNQNKGVKKYCYHIYLKIRRTLF